MPGFMGLRGLERKNPLEMQKERRKNERGDTRRLARDTERRSREKAQEILNDQEREPDDRDRGAKAPPAGEGVKTADRKITEIMSGRVAVLDFDDTLLTVQGIFAGVRFRHLPVVDDSGRIIGIISDRDLLRMVSPFYGTVNEQTRDVEIMNRKVGLIMTRNPICIETGATVLDAVKLMNANNISCLPVLDPEALTLLGIVSWKDIVRAFLPGGFASDTARMVKTDPKAGDSARLRAKTSESERLRAANSESDRQRARLNEPI